MQSPQLLLGDSCSWSLPVPRPYRTPDEVLFIKIKDLWDVGCPMPQNVPANHIVMTNINDDDPHDKESCKIEMWVVPPDEYANLVKEGQEIERKQFQGVAFAIHQQYGKFGAKPNILIPKAIK